MTQIKTQIKCRACRFYQPTDPPTVRRAHRGVEIVDLEFGLCEDAERRAKEAVPYAIVGIQATMIAADVEHSCPTFEPKNG